MENNNKMINTLAPGVILHGSSYNYRIERTLGQGGFGITYLATVRMKGALGSIDANVKVAVKEFFMREINGRVDSAVTSSSQEGLYADYQKKFLREAQNLSKLHHPNIIKVIESFSENNTVYYAMEYVDGGNLNELIEKSHGLPEKNVLEFISEIGDALSFMHQTGMLHLDLKPSNIMIHNGQAVLIDFGLSKQYDSEGEPESSTKVGSGTPGYAPIEQANYHEGQEFPVTMDVYALGATMYKMLTSEQPPEASDVLNEGLPVETLQKHDVSESTMHVIECAMSPMKKQRPQSVEAFLKMLHLETKHYEREEKQNAVIGTTPEIQEDAEEDTVTGYEQQTSQDALESAIGFTVNGVQFNMMKVNGGTFLMGDTFQEKQSRWERIKQLMSDTPNDDKPVHNVTLADYYVGQTEVTQALWEAVMGSNPSYFKGLKKPVEQVSWKDCQKFISKISFLTGKHFRLPTEAEWEFAARGGRNSSVCKYSGNDDVGKVAWYEANSKGETHDVTVKHPNDLGLYDMSGNVWEWCVDWYYKYRSKSQTNPYGIDSDSYHIVRGGSWNSNICDCSVSHRGIDKPDCRKSNIGLRLVLANGAKFMNDVSVFVKDVAIQMVKVDGGTFQMGATSEQGRSGAEDEYPVHSVTLSDYYIGMTVVTQKLWLTVMGQNPSAEVGWQKPVECVSWEDCQEFISRLNELTNKQFRMPTEAEWEFAARGGNISKGYKYSGSNNIDEVGWHFENSGIYLQDVALKAPNELGLYDMSGNINEWCSDWYGDYCSESQTDPQGCESGSFRTYRGGFYRGGENICRVSARADCQPIESRNPFIGLRLVMNIL